MPASLMPTTICTLAVTAAQPRAAAAAALPGTPSARCARSAAAPGSRAPLLRLLAPHAAVSSSWRSRSAALALARKGRGWGASVGTPSGGQGVVRVCAEGGNKYSGNTKLRSEAQAPFRTARTFVFGGFAAASALGTFFGLVRFIGAALGAPNAVALPVAASDLGIDLGALALCLFVLKRDADAKEKQMARISREERLAALKVELTNGKTVTLQKLRNFARPVIVCGPTKVVEEHMQAAEPFRAALLERGVLTVPVCLDGGVPELPEEEEGEGSQRWRARPVLMEKWSEWLSEQMKLGKVEEGQAVYLSLRMDGRVRSSGKGCPPWEILSMQLPPVSGIWAGMGDGFDGYVGEQ